MCVCVWRGLYCKAFALYSITKVLVIPFTVESINLLYHYIISRFPNPQPPSSEHVQIKGNLKCTINNATLDSVRTTNKARQRGPGSLHSYVDPTPTPSSPTPNLPQPRSFQIPNTDSIDREHCVGLVKRSARVRDQSILQRAQS